MLGLIVVGLIFAGLILVTGLVICAIVVLTGHVVRSLGRDREHPGELS